MGCRCTRNLLDPGNENTCFHIVKPEARCEAVAPDASYLYRAPVVGGPRARNSQAIDTIDALGAQCRVRREKKDCGVARCRRPDGVQNQPGRGHKRRVCGTTWGAYKGRALALLGAIRASQHQESDPKEMRSECHVSGLTNRVKLRAGALAALASG